jgi:hypothetical protein
VLNVVDYWPEYLVWLTPTMYRQVANELRCKGRVDERRRFLVAPSTLGNDYEFFSFYFRPLPFRLRPDWDPAVLPEYIQKFSIRYVVYSKTYASRELYNPHYNETFGKLPDDYSLEDEDRRLYDAMVRMGGKVIYDSSLVLIVELPVDETGSPASAPVVEKNGVIKGAPFYQQVNNFFNMVDLCANQTR